MSLLMVQQAEFFRPPGAPPLYRLGVPVRLVIRVWTNKLMEMINRLSITLIPHT